jgi:SAM-dependent methyltransferase
MRSFWDRRAREDPFYFVDNRLSYRDPDPERFWNGGEEALDALLQAAGVEVRPTDSIVDIGSGVGRLTRPLATRASEVWAVEISEEMLDLARGHNAHLSNVNWVLGDGRSLTGIRDASVDGCVSLVVFQHIPSAEVIMSYIREMGRVLRHGGWAAFQVSNDPSVHRPPSVVARMRGTLSPRRPRGQGAPPWLGTAVDLVELRSVATSAGLELVRIFGEGTQFCIVGARRVAD